MPYPSKRTPSRNGLGVVILGFVLVVCSLVNMWLRAPLIAEVLGPSAYGIAFFVSAIAACVAALIFDDDEFSEQVEEALPGEPMLVPVEVRSRPGDPRN